MPKAKLTVNLTSPSMSVAAGAGEVVTWSNMQYMQDMTPAICASQTTPTAGATTVPTKTLTDSRDGSTYTIAKLKDSNCWMTQNLRILSTLLTPDDSDVTDNYYVPASVSFDKTAANDTPKYFSSSDTYQSRIYYNNDTSYGVYYTWHAATAGTGDASITTNGANAPSSICPKGWRLPTGGSNGEFYTLLNGLSGSTITSAPYNFVYGGWVDSSTLLNAGSYGYYWSSTAYTAVSAYYLVFNTIVNPSSSWDRYRGYSVRCVAR